MKSFITIIFFASTLHLQGKECVAVFSDTLIRSDYKYISTLEIYQNSTYCYQFRSSWTSQMIICGNAVNDNFIINGTVKISDETYYLAQGVSANNDSNNHFSYVLKDFKLQKNASEVKIKICSYFRPKPKTGKSEIKRYTNRKTLIRRKLS